MANDTVAVSVDGLRDLREDLKELAIGAHKELRVVFNDAAERVVTDARRRAPVGKGTRKSGAVKKSIRAKSTQTRARVVGGGKRVPYYGWLDFGGRVGIGRSISRNVIPGGRYIYPAFEANRAETLADLEEALIGLARKHGLSE